MKLHWIVLVTLALGACASDELDAGAIEARLDGFDTSGEFTLINAAPMESQHAAETVNVWVSGEGLDLYRGVDPSDETDTVDAFPEATMIVKEMLDDTGARVAFTVMVKGAKGGEPETAGWWWGVFGAEGDLQQGGSIDFCIDCHERRGLERTDWVRGVDLDNRL